MLSLRKTAARFCAVLIAAAILATAPQPVAAQDFFTDLLGGIFGNRPPPRRGPPGGLFEGPRVRRMAPDDFGPPPRYPRERKRLREPSQAPSAGSAPARHAPSQTSRLRVPKEKPQATKFVAVIGDSLGQMLADGLDENFADKPDIAILHKARENSGLVRADVFDWRKGALDVTAGPGKLDMAVIMIGSNDRQPVVEQQETVEPLAPHWRDLYAARVDAIIDAFKEKKIPLVWVGMPVMKSESFSSHMAQINEIFRERTARAGVDYVDLWEAFADEHSRYEAFGPDLRGQIVRLRAADGVQFTADGARKLAHFVAGQITKRLETPSAPDIRVTPDPAQNGAPGAAAAPEAGPALAPAQTPTDSAKIVFTPPIAGPQKAPTLPEERPAVGAKQSLTSREGEKELTRRSTSPGAPSVDPAPTPARALQDHVILKGGDPLPRKNRADDFSLPD